ncbi:MAG: formylglycine-generating enzyme family protein, partial [Thermoguttaceae bacterium]
LARGQYGKQGGLLMGRIKSFVAIGLLVVTGVWGSWAWGLFRSEPTAADSPTAPPEIGRMVRLAGGPFRMGNDLANDPAERPAHEVFLSPLLIDEHEVTNRQFAQFVAQTGMHTTAQQRGWSYVFDRNEQEWVRCDGADWRHPGGPDTSLDGRDDSPVVHVSWYDATAYARWSGKQLPTEAQWEYAARSGLRDANFPWGREERIDGRYQANYRQHGKDPWADGFEGLAPVKSYPASRFALYDMSGNVWEWCADRYGEDYYGTGPREDPAGPDEGPLRVIRGGSWLSPENYCLGHHVSTRGKRPAEETSQHVGFRCVRSAER